jgi:hypothetical protein
MTRILLGQLAANGDCACATILARQLRHDYPDAHLSWAISSSCAGLLKNNPHVDEIWEIPARGWNTQAAMWRMFEQEAFHRYQRREFDQILLSQVWPGNLQNFDGTVRPPILRSLGRPITVPIENVLRLTDDEIERVEAFVRENDIEGFEHRILFECESRSGQSFITPELAQDIARKLYELLLNATVIFSTIKPMTLHDKRSRYAGQLSLREVAQLTHACTAFVGAGSGGTVIATSSAAKPLPTVLLLRADTSVFGSFAHDLEYFGIDHPGIVETSDENIEHVAALIARVCKEGPDSVLAEPGIGIPVNFEHYATVLELNLFPRQGYLDAARSLLVTAGRYGWTEELIQFGRQRIEPNLAIDPSVIFAPNRAFADRFRSTLADGARHSMLAPVQVSAKEQGLVG